jgi:hypothetical protein
MNWTQMQSCWDSNGRKNRQQQAQQPMAWQQLQAKRVPGAVVQQREQQVKGQLRHPLQALLVMTSW